MDFEDLLGRIARSVERGKVDRSAAYPAEEVGQNGVVEWTAQALAAGCPPTQVLDHGLIRGMSRIGEKFAAGEAFVPDLLFSAQAMKAAVEQIRPYFLSGELAPRGRVILGTVAGDLHDIGKNIVRMVLEGGGWLVEDLGVDAGTDRFLRALEAEPRSLVGMSALLTTTMLQMSHAVSEIKKRDSAVRIFVGGAPLSREFAEKIGADGYFPEPVSFVRHLEATDIEG